MSVKLPAAVAEETKSFTIDLGGGQSFEIDVRRPTFADQVTILGARNPADQMQCRLSAMVTGWRGVEDDQEPPQPVPFSVDAMVKLLQIYPQAFPQVSAALIDLFHTHPGDLAKNLPTPLANGGTTTPVEITASTTHSDSGASSDAVSP